MALKHCMLMLRPSRLLGLFFWSQLSALVAVLVWQKVFPGCLFIGVSVPELKLQNWLFLIGVEAAVTGWVVASYMTLRNSIKQHTINTLLQTRLSATYMAEAKCINKAFFPPGPVSHEPMPLEYFSNSDNNDTIGSVNYLINYFEFMAVAIRHGDLDEKVLRHTLRGILVRFYSRMSLYIKNQRGDDGVQVKHPDQLEHLTWLYNQWKDKKAKPSKSEPEEE